MDREATKTRGEREDEEVERLVRPSPKVKPPRHDRRRETVEVDAEPDLETKDKDLSKNFKDIGGSVASRVLERWAGALPPPRSGVFPKVTPKPPSPAGAGSKPPPGPAKKVKVRSKNTGWVGWISKQKLKEDPANYEVAEDSAEETFKGKPKAKPPAPKAEPKTAPQSEGAAPQNVEKDMAARDALRDLAVDDPSFAAFLKSFKRPDSDISQFAKNNPKFRAEALMQGKALPEGIKTVGDLARVLALQGEAPKPKKGPKQPSKNAPSSDDAQRKELKERLKGVKEELKEDPKSEGAKKDRAAIKEALKAQADYDNIAKELEETKAALAKLQQKGPPSEEEVRSRAQEILKQKKQKPKKKPGEQPAAPPAEAPAEEPAPPAGTPAPPAAPEEEPESESPPEEPEAEEEEAPPAPGAPAQTTAPTQPAPAAAGTPAVPPAAAPAAGKAKKGPKKDPNAPKVPKQALPKGKGEDPNAPPEPVYAPFQPERKVSSSEREASDRLVMSTFPTEMASKILFGKPRYHPDEIRELVSDYNLAKSVPASQDISSLVDKASSFYSTDPNTVPPPKTVKAEDGTVVDFKSLTDPVEQAKAYRRHQVQTVAMSLAAQSAVANSLEGNGAPKDLAGVMSGFMLSGPGETPSDRVKRATDEAERLFYSGLQTKTNEPPLSDKAVTQLLQSSNDLAVQKLVVGYCQAKDYRDARKLFLDPKSPVHISEQQSPKAIAAGLRKAADFLQNKAKRYPDGTTSQDTSTTFRDRVMKHLGTLSPGKQGAVQKQLDHEENTHYDHEMKRYDKAAKLYKKEVEKASKEYESAYQKYSRILREHGDIGADPPLGVEDRLLENKIVAPKKPIKPPRYDVLTKQPEELEEGSSNLWDDFASRNASHPRVASRVAARHAFSIYSGTCAMDRSAVYWGVAPYPKGHEGFEPYKGWEQPQARDLGESDYSRVLKAARNWLSTPVLSTNIEGVVRDTQLRAALDLALRAENYDHALHPALYNKLLARLAGVSEDKTLLTVRSKTARNTMSNKKVELETAQADQFLARLDRIASVVQANHKQWGMGFTAAKNLVNAVDALADDLESATYGAASLLNRQASEIGQAKLAQVIQRDSDEGYMDTFKNPQAPVQTEADEPYMKAYSDDQSSAVHNGRSTTGRPLAK